MDRVRESGGMQLLQYVRPRGYAGVRRVRIRVMPFLWL